MKSVTCPKTGIEYSNQEEYEFYQLLCRGKTLDALIFAARNVAYGKLGTYALGRAVEQYDRLKKVSRS